MRTSIAFSLAASSLVALVAAQDKYEITGVPHADDGPVSVRRDIEDLQAEAGPQWDLYIRALTALKSRDYDDQLSFFQIAGVHGLPFIEWGNAGRQRGNGWLGYCPHGEGLFLPWHRPYVLLYEQELVAAAKEIALEYHESVRDKYVQAANDLRSPYWDWAKTSAVPPSTVPAKITINMPSDNGTAATSVDNPLRGFDYPAEARQGKLGRFPSSQRTTRCSSNGRSYPNSANANLRSRNLKSNLYAVYTYATTFSQFSRDANRGLGLEQIHDWIHLDAPCGESFFDIGTSGFDPLFMLHHTNVDRLWAYFQFMKPAAANLDTRYYGQSRWDTPQGTVITSASPLSPFFDGDDKFHTSDSVVSINGFGYTYDGLNYWNMTADDLKTAATSKINALYGNGNNGNNNNNNPPATNPWSGFPGFPNGFPNRKRGNNNNNNFQGMGTNTQYFASIQLERAEVERPASVDVYIAGQKAGGLVLMSHPASGELKGGFTVEGPVATAFSMLGNNDRSLSLLEKFVTVKITKPDGSVIPLQTVPSLKIALEKVDVEMPKSASELPKASNAESIAIAAKSA